MRRLIVESSARLIVALAIGYSLYDATYQSGYRHGIAMGRILGVADVVKADMERELAKLERDDPTQPFGGRSQR